MSAPTRLHARGDSSRTNRSAIGYVGAVLDGSSLANFTRFESFRLDDPADLTVTIATTEDVQSLVVDWSSRNLLNDLQDRRLAMLVDAAARAVIDRPNTAIDFILDYYPTHLHNEVGRRTAVLTATMRPGVDECVLITVTRAAR